MMMMHIHLYINVLFLISFVFAIIFIEFGKTAELQTIRSLVDHQSSNDDVHVECFILQSNDGLQTNFFIPMHMKNQSTFINDHLEDAADYDYAKPIETPSNVKGLDSETLQLIVQYWNITNKHAIDSLLPTKLFENNPLQHSTMENLNKQFETILSRQEVNWIKTKLNPNTNKLTTIFSGANFLKFGLLLDLLSCFMAILLSLYDKFPLIPQSINIEQLNNDLPVELLISIQKYLPYNHSFILYKNSPKLASQITVNESSNPLIGLNIAKAFEFAYVTPINDNTMEKKFVEFYGSNNISFPDFLNMHYVNQSHIKCKPNGVECYFTYIFIADSTSFKRVRDDVCNPVFFDAFFQSAAVSERRISFYGDVEGPYWFDTPDNCKYEGYVDINALILPPNNHNNTSIQILISHTDFKGPIQMNKLNITTLILNDNKFNGNINMKDIPQTVMNLDLSNNQFSGTVDFTHLPSNLQKLDLSHNNFNGNIDLNNLPKSLNNLDISNNKFIGTIYYSQMNHIPSTLVLNDGVKALD